MQARNDKFARPKDHSNKRQKKDELLIMKRCKNINNRANPYYSELPHNYSRCSIQ